MARWRPESRALFQAMLMLFELLMAVFMERRTTKDNRNSSKPSSQTSKDDTAVSQSWRQRQGQEAEQCALRQHPDGRDRSDRRSHVCETCGEDLSKHPVSSGMKDARRSISSSKKWSATLMPRSSSVPDARRRPRDGFPADMPGPLQYGPGIKAYILNMLIAQMVSLKRVQQSIKTLIGQVISEATMLKYVMQLHHCLERLGTIGH